MSRHRGDARALGAHPSAVGGEGAAKLGGAENSNVVPYALRLHLAREHAERTIDAAVPAAGGGRARLRPYTQRADRAAWEGQ